MEIKYEGNRKSAIEVLQDFKDMTGMLKPYLPKIPKVEPVKQREWKKNNYASQPFPKIKNPNIL